MLHKELSERHGTTVSDEIVALLEYVDEKDHENVIEICQEIALGGYFDGSLSLLEESTKWLKAVLNDVRTQLNNK